MVADIHAFAEYHNADGKWEQMLDISFFEFCNYRIFGWLADVRNYSEVGPVVAPRGLPDDVSPSVQYEFDGVGADAHTPSWLSVDELLAVDYEVMVEDRRDIGSHRPAEQGPRLTLREFLGAQFLDDLALLQRAGAERVVFWFDN